MNINWKDFGLMFVIGLIVYLITFIATATFMSFYEFVLFTALLRYGIPIAFYFWRNRSDIKEAATISFVFGITFMLFSMIVIYLAYFILISITSILQIEHASTLLIPGVTDWVGLVSTLLFYYGILVMIYGLIIWFAVKKLKWEKS